MRQIKKRLLVFSFAVCTLVGTMVTPSSSLSAPASAQAAAQEKTTTVSDVAVQKSVINEQNQKTLDKKIEKKEKWQKGWINANPSVKARKEPKKDAKVVKKFTYNTCIAYTKASKNWAKIKYKNKYCYVKIKYISKRVDKTFNAYQKLIDNISDNDKYLIYQITYAESGNQRMKGQRAVVEVILNRVLSDKYPDTVEGVLSQRGQFSTWKLRNKVKHNKEQEKALKLIYSRKPVLTKDYLMFSRGKFSWGRNYVKIQDHWFGTF